VTPPEVVDLDRERRTRAILAELALLAPKIDPTRTRAELALLDALALSPALEAAPMPEGTAPATRLPVELLARADELVPLLAARPELAAHGRVTRSTVVRLALARGLDALAADLAAPPKGRKGARG
jgi:hypothetical protein